MPLYEGSDRQSQPQLGYYPGRQTICIFFSARGTFNAGGDQSRRTSPHRPALSPHRSPGNHEGIPVQSDWPHQAAAPAPSSADTSGSPYSPPTASPYAIQSPASPRLLGASASSAPPP